MAGLFGGPKEQNTAVPNPGDTSNRINDALVRRLAAGGTQSDTLTSPGASTGTQAPSGPTLTGIR